MQYFPRNFDWCMVLRVIYICHLILRYSSPIKVLAILYHSKIEHDNQLWWSTSRPMCSDSWIHVKLLSGWHCCYFLPLCLSEWGVYIIAGPAIWDGTTVIECRFYLSCSSWYLWPLPFGESMPEDGATLVEQSSLRKHGRPWTSFSRLGNCTDFYVCLHESTNAIFLEIQLRH